MLESLVQNRQRVQGLFRLSVEIPKLCHLPPFDICNSCSTCLFLIEDFLKVPELFATDAAPVFLQSDALIFFFFPDSRLPPPSVLALAPPVSGSVL